MARRLKAYVHLADDVGQVHSFGPDSDIPGWAEAKITNEGAWESDDDDDGVPAQSDKKAAWVDYAVSKGVAREDAEAMTKEDLIAEFG